MGDHTYRPFLLMRAQHCDGFDTVVRNSCLPAGEVPYGPTRALTVTAPLTSPGAEIRDRLERIPGLTIVDDVPLDNGDRFFRLIFNQPIDHRDPSLGSFGQRLTLLHTDKTHPMVLHTTGYELLDFPFLAETTTADRRQSDFSGRTLLRTIAAPAARLVEAHHLAGRRGSPPHRRGVQDNLHAALAVDGIEQGWNGVGVSPTLLPGRCHRDDRLRRAERR